MGSIADLKSYIDKRLSKQTGEVRIGVESEFFLFKGDELVTLDESQNFLEEIRKTGIFYVREMFRNSNLIKKLSMDTVDNGYYTIKYEYPPHLLEVAYGHYSSVSELLDSLNFIESMLLEVSKKLDIDIRYLPSVDPTLVDFSVVQKVDHIQAVLLKDRKIIAEKKNLSFNQSEFPAYIASNQVTISGTNWIEQKNFISILYTLEPTINYIYKIFACRKWPNLVKFEDFRKRNKLYALSFGDYELFGYPNSTSWSPDKWISFSKKNAKVANNVSSIFDIRDLQFIKPKKTGALEFRDTLSVGGKESLFFISCVRLAVYLLSNDFGTREIGVVNLRDKSLSSYNRIRINIDLIISTMRSKECFRSCNKIEDVIKELEWIQLKIPS